MFKNAIIYRILAGGIDAETVNESLDELAFLPCAASQEKSVGWVPPRGDDHGALAELVAGQWILKLMIETKSVPASSIKTRIDLWKKEIERQTGRKPGKKETREQQDDIRLALLPMAFAKQSAILVWVDNERNLLVIDAASQGKADDAVTLLVKSIDGLALQQIVTQSSPAGAMAEWLVQKEGPKGFSIDRECELKASDESKAVVKYNRHSLDIDEVVQHIAMGKVPTKLAMTYQDRISFVMTDAMWLKKIEILDVETDAHGRDGEDAFDADVAIATGELTKVIESLIESMGGEVSIHPETK